MRFTDFMAEIEAEAQAEGPEAVAELDALRRHFASIRNRADQSAEIDIGSRTVVGFVYFEYGVTLVPMARTTRSIGAGTAVAVGTRGSPGHGARCAERA